MPKMPQGELGDKPNWQAIVEEGMRAAVRSAIECVVEEELAAGLGPRYARSGHRAGYRHGSKARRLTTSSGPVALAVPRGGLQHPDSRSTERQSVILPCYARRMRQVSVALLQVKSRCTSGVHESLHQARVF